MNKSEVRQLKHLRKLLEMGTKDFSMAGDNVRPCFTHCFGEEFDMTREMPADEFVRKATRVWRQSWILPVLDSLILKYDK